MSDIEDNSNVPYWAMFPAPATSSIPRQKPIKTKLSKQSDQELTATKLFECKGVWFHEAQREWKCLWLCKNCNKEVLLKPNSGYTNLVNHCKTKKCLGGPVAFEEKLGEFRNSTTQTRINFQPKHSHMIHDVMGWMKVVVYKDEPLSIVTDSFNKNVTHVGGDHVTSNIKLAEEQLKKPMVGCRNHRQSLELNRMMSKVSVVKNVVQTCHKVMRKASTNKVAAELRNTTNLRAKLYNKTRWRGKFETVKQYLKMEPALKKASGMEELMIQDEEDEFERQELEEEDDNGKTFKFKARLLCYCYKLQLKKID